MGGEVPGLLLRRADEQESSCRRPGALQCTREVAAALDPAGRREQLTQHLHLACIHPAIVPPRSLG
jgi:hypothetical protein